MHGVLRPAAVRGSVRTSGGRHRRRPGPVEVQPRSVVSDRPKSRQPKPGEPRSRPSSAASPGPSRSPGSSGSSGSPGSTGFRRTAERLSYPVILRLHRMPRWVVTIGLAALLVAGLLTPAPYGPVCLGVVVALMAWLTYLAWHEGDRSRRVIRLVALALGGAALAIRIIAA
ncbi:DUF6703 family protein [Actinopolymorpha sp. NPDC004070]|uniref:DUF6703 family protein n=1 Tax=Actinopolymorpha sp. NPDC004070 TaxID=3154548 RepID=UPI0033BE6AAB